MSCVVKKPIYVLNYDSLDPNDETSQLFWNTFNQDGILTGPGIYLYHQIDQHFDLLVPRDSCLANQVYKDKNDILFC